MSAERALDKNVSVFGYVHVAMMDESRLVQRLRGQGNDQKQKVDNCRQAKAHKEQKNKSLGSGTAMEEELEEHRRRLEEAINRVEAWEGAHSRRMQETIDHVEACEGA